MVGIPTLAECEQALGEPASTWTARCHEIASALVRAGVVDGRSVYGHYLGQVAAESRFARQARWGFVPHGWISLPDGRVLDPTRWTFECVEPYLYLSPTATEAGAREYDEGGNRLRVQMLEPPPAFDAAGKAFVLDLDGETRRYVHDFLLDGSPGVSLRQLVWLANLPLQLLADHARPLFHAIEQVGHGAFIPTDNRERVTGKAA
jgi:hypothetical protein